MSSGNNDNAAGGGAILVFAFLGVLAMIFLLLLAFIAFVMTLFAFYAWNQPRRIGKITILPEEARGFVHRGLAGMVIVPAFLLFINVFFGIFINWDLLPHILAGGYVIGSLGMEIIFADMEDGSGTVDPAPIQPQQQILPPARTLSPPRQPEPFRFASWDDEGADQ